MTAILDSTFTHTKLRELEFWGFATRGVFPASAMMTSLDFERNTQTKDRSRRL